MTASLRARLMLGLVALVVAGLLVSDVVTYAQLQQFLVSRVDDQLTSGQGDAMAILHYVQDPRDEEPEEIDAGGER